jgi:FMN phosphatase YigB (HAD superfamily)
MLNMVNTTRMNRPIPVSTILHVGDNEYADIEGAKQAGIPCFKINSNEKTIKDIP